MSLGFMSLGMSLGRALQHLFDAIENLDKATENLDKATVVKDKDAFKTKLEAELFQLKLQYAEARAKMDWDIDLLSTLRAKIEVYEEALRDLRYER
jgi:hypothetical protein